MYQPDRRQAQDNAPYDSNSIVDAEVDLIQIFAVNVRIVGDTCQRWSGLDTDLCR
jgi:hypothetical protein